MRKEHWGYALWLFSVLLLWFFENNAGTRVLLAASLMLPAFSALCAFLALRGASASLEAPDECAEGGPAQCRCRLVAPRLSLFCRLGAVLSCAHSFTLQRSALEPAPDGSFQPDTSVCGVLELSVDHIAASDWFGLFSFARAACASAELTVLPACYPVALHGGLREAVPSSRVSSAGLRDETLGVRPYLPGDPVRLIHWKLSEKLDQTLLRQRGTPEDSPVLLLLDQCCVPETSLSEMGSCIKAFLSAASALLEEGLPFDAALPSRDGVFLLPVRCADDWRQLAFSALRTCFSSGDEPVGRRFSALFPDAAPTHPVLFSACAAADAASLFRGHTVTLVLPAPAPSFGSEISVQVFAPGSAELWL